MSQPALSQSPKETMMQLFVKVIPLKAGTTEPAGEPWLQPCPPGVEPDTVLSFLTQHLGEHIAKTWTSTERHQRIDTGWLFPWRPSSGRADVLELACVPFIRVDDGSLRPMFEVQADQRQMFEELAASGTLSYTVIERPHREYQPTVSRQHTPATGGQDAPE